MTLSPIEFVMVVLVLVLVAAVITVGLFLGWPAGFLAGVMGVFALSCLAGAVGLGGGGEGQ